MYGQIWSCDLASAERDNASKRIVGGHAHRDPITRHDLDAESPHPAAQLGQYFMA